MGRNRVRKTTIGMVKAEDMSEAVDMVLNGICSGREAARRKNIPHQTLARYIKKKLIDSSARMCPKYNARQVFSTSMEKELVNYLLQCSKMCYGIGYSECRKLAFQLASKNSITVPNNWNTNEMASIDWMKDFIKRNPVLSLRKPEACSLSRATSFNRHNVSLFYTKLEDVLKRHVSFSDGSRIYNLDETGCTTVQSPKRVISQKGVKRLNQITSAERGVLVTVCCIVNAYGHAIPPVIIFPRVRFKDHMINGAPPGTTGLACQSGWMNSVLFIETLKHFIKYTNSSKENPSLLIMDNHESHISLNAIDLAKGNGVTILTLPPHCSNRLQPLDVSVYGPFKSFYNSSVDSWLQRNPGRTLDIYSITPCINSAFEKSMTPKNIKAGFKATGIFPFDKNIFTDDDFAVSAVTDRPNENKDYLESVPDKLQPQTNISESNLQESSSITEIETVQNISSKTNDEINSDMCKEKSVQTTNVSPENIRPYPKAGARKNININRQKKKSAIMTDTPEKIQIEISTKIKNNKIKKSLFSKKTKPLKPCNENGTLSDDFDELCRPIFTSDVSDAESFSCDQITGFEELDKEPEEGDFVLVKFASSEFKQKINKVFYVGKIIKNMDEDRDLGISYLRSYKKSKTKFIMPIVPDLATVCLKDIVTILPKPKMNGKTARQKAFYSFEVNLSNFEIR